MSSERGLWKTAQRRLSPFGVLKRLENRVEEGTPDVLYTLRRLKVERSVKIFIARTGLFEMKEDVWPKLERTPLCIESLSREQVLWQEDWEKFGGHVGTLAQIGRDYLWLPPAQTRLVFERKLSRHQLQPFVLGSGEFPTSAVLWKLIGHE